VPVVLTPGGTATPAPTTDIIEIELASDYRVRIENGIKAASMRLVLDALERR
jgi:hypothetical protein